MAMTESKKACIHINLIMNIFASFGEGDNLLYFYISFAYETIDNFPSVVMGKTQGYVMEFCYSRKLGQT